MREWPATWYAPFPKEHIFDASRDMRGADLKGNGEWVIEIASGYSRYIYEAILDIYHK